MQITEPSIVVFHEKHGDRYFLVNNQEDLEALAVHMVLERAGMGYWYYFESEKPTEPKVSKAEGLKLGGRLTEASVLEWIDYERNLREYNYEQKDSETLDKIKGGWKSPEIRKLALRFLENRRDSEYEGFDVESPEEYKKDFE